MSAVTAPSSARLLLPERPVRVGPITRFLRRRLLVALAVVEIVGLVLLVRGSDAWAAFGTSLVFPGAGFVTVAWPLLFVLTLALLLVALVLWWGASAHAAIPAVWLASAVIPALMVDGPRLLVARGSTWRWPAGVLAMVFAVASGVAAALPERRRHRAKAAQVPELNAYLQTVEVIDERPAPRTPDAMDAELLRWACAIAWQSPDDLHGLDWGEQFHSGTQLRYQLNALCWALSLYAANFVPNAVGQMTDVIGELVHRHTDLRVWGYWRTLNLLGNLDPSPDPLVRDNIMLSGFLGDVINIFEAATGSDRFDQPGSLTFVWKDGRTFPYDHHSLAEAVRKNFERSRLGFFPCEPGWAFTVCNVMGAQALYGHDRLHGTDWWNRVEERWIKTLDEEYLTPDGTYAHIKSSHVGLVWDTGEVPGGHYLAAGSNRMADIAPDHAWRAAALEQRTAEKKIRGLAAMVKDGRLEMELPKALDRHRARSSALAAWNGVIGGATRFGESTLRAAALDASARQCATGARFPERPLDGSVPAIGGHMIVRWTGPLNNADLNKRGYVPPVGPVLDTTGWRDVLVTEARSTDGTSLTVRLLVPDDAPATAVLRFSGLTPGATHRISGDIEASFVADGDGCASTSATVSGTAAFELTPVAS